MLNSENWESLFYRFAPEFIVGVSIKSSRKRDWKQGQWRPPTSKQKRILMQRMRSEGMTIGDIARACKVTWRTAWKHSKIQDTQNA